MFTESTNCVPVANLGTRNINVEKAHNASVPQLVSVSWEKISSKKEKYQTGTVK